MSNRSKCLPSVCFKVVVEAVDTEEKQRKLFPHERNGTLLKALWEVEVDILAILFCKIACPSILRSVCDTVLSIESKSFSLKS